MSTQSGSDTSRMDVDHDIISDTTAEQDSEDDLYDSPNESELEEMRHLHYLEMAENLPFVKTNMPLSQLQYLEEIERLNDVTHRLKHTVVL
jgi:hypothetical protein